MPMQRTVSESRTSISKEMAKVIAENAARPARIFVEAQAYDGEKFRGLLIVNEGMQGELPTVSTNAVFKTAEAADAHMRSLVEQIREAAIVGGVQDL